jgi:hypothetical protein
LVDVWNCEMSSFYTVARLAQTIRQREETLQRIVELTNLVQSCMTI